MSYEWDQNKANLNFQKHGIQFADAVAIFEDVQALWQKDVGHYGEERFVAVGMDHLGHILTVVFTFRDKNIRIISARKATKSERKAYER